MKLRNPLFMLAILALLPLLFVSCKSTKTASDTPVATAEDSAESSVTRSVPEPVRSLLWEISGNGLTESSYLYGTIHIIGSNDYLMPQAVEEAFAQTELLALEIDMDDPGMMRAMMGGMMMEGDTTLTDLLSPEDYQLARDFLLDSADVPEIAIKQIEKMMPFLALSTIYPKMIDGEMRSYEQEFMNMAKARELEIVGVESIEAQLGTIAQIPYQAQASMLMEYVRDFAGQKALMADMIDLYRKQDIEGLLALMDESEGGNVGDFEEILLENRNRNWIPVMGKLAKQQPTFFAVGAGHLAGKTGVIQLLRDAGYTVKPVM